MTQLPLYAIRYVDILDFPNHLARLHVLVHLEGSPALQSFYVASPGLFPNMAMDLVVPVLARAVGLETGLKLFASLGSLAVATGTLALTLALTGRLTALALGSLLFVHNAFLHLGLFNFVLGVGGALWLLAGWIAVRSRRAPPGPALLAAFAVGALLLYLCHLSAFGIYLLGLFAYESATQRGAPVRALPKLAARVAVQVLPALGVHLLAFAPGVEGPAASIEGASAGAVAVYKVVLALVAPGLAIDSDPVTAGLVWLPATIGLYFLWKRGRVGFSRPGMRIVAAFALALLLLPPTVFGSHMVDARMALPIALAFWASLDPRHDCPTAQRSLGLAMTACVVIISAAVALRWSDSAPLQRDLRTAMLSIREGSRVAVVTVARDDARPSLGPHVAAWSVIDRSVFLSSLFIRPFQPFLVGYRAEFADVARQARFESDFTSPTIEAISGHFDYAVIFGSEADTARYSGNAITLHGSAVARLVELR